MNNVFIPSLPTRYDAATETRVPSLDLNPAAEYGTLVNLSCSTIEEIKQAAEQIGRNDLILCVGDVTLTAVAIAVCCKRNGCANLLRWSKVTRAYSVEQVVI